jgi:KDO2-lipid IV(A) lauroyltransferase
MQYRLWRAATWLFRLLPLRCGYAIADAAGVATFWLWPRGRRNVLRNYRRVLPEAGESDRRRIARRSFQNYCRYLVDFLRLPGTPAEAARLAGQGADAFGALDRALEAGRGAIVVCMHFGNWDMGAAATAARGYAGAALGERFGDPRLDAMVFGGRRRLGVEVFPVDGPLMGPARHLRRNGVLALLIDQPDPASGVEVTFFGARTSVPKGPARLALGTGAAPGVAAFPRINRDRPEVGVLAEFSEQPCGGDKDAAIATLTQWFMSAHERFIRRYPDQWYMFRDMWPDAP